MLYLEYCRQSAVLDNLLLLDGRLALGKTWEVGCLHGSEMKGHRSECTSYKAFEISNYTRNTSEERGRNEFHTKNFT